MALYGSVRDVSFFRHISRELINNIIEQEVDFYELYLPDTKSNVYGEGTNKSYYAPVRLTCLIERGDQNVTSAEQFGLDAVQTHTFRFLRKKLVEINLVPQIGDIIEDRGNFYEIVNTNENQFFVGKDDNFPKTPGPDFGTSFSIICLTHLARVNRLQIIKSRL